MFLFERKKKAVSETPKCSALCFYLDIFAPKRWHFVPVQRQPNSATDLTKINTPTHNLQLARMLKAARPTKQTINTHLKLILRSNLALEPFSRPKKQPNTSITKSTFKHHHLNLRPEHAPGAMAGRVSVSREFPSQAHVRHRKAKLGVHLRTRWLPVADSGYLFLTGSSTGAAIFAMHLLILIISCQTVPRTHTQRQSALCI